MLISGIPPWVVFHVPHDSIAIPAELRDQFILSDEELACELIQMTDHHTRHLVPQNTPHEQIIRFPLSRLLVDVERFEDDQAEPMAAIGMGVIYTVTHELKPLRRVLSSAEKEHLLLRWYRPHHELLTNNVQQSIERHGLALIVDLHSFPSVALPYENDPAAFRPEICIGSDSFHTPIDLVNELTRCFESSGFEVGINTPFSGSMVSAHHFKSDVRVQSVMIEVRRDLYLDEKTGMQNAQSDKVKQKLQDVLIASLNFSL